MSVDIRTLKASGGTTSVEELITDLHCVLDHCGIDMSCSKVARVVRQYDFRARPKGIAFDWWLYHKLSMTVAQQQRFIAHPHYARVIAYSDPTGEHAVSRVLSARGF